MSSSLVEPAAAAHEPPRGHETPRIQSIPEYVSSLGRDVVDLSAAAGLHLDPWQVWTLDQALGERADGSWSAFEVGLTVPRQNGKGAVFEARVLAGLFLLEEQLILYSAHEFKSAREMFLRITELVNGSPEFRKRVRKVTTSHGEEGIELKSGQRLRFIARSRGSGRGFSGECNIWDEAQNLPDAMVDALMPTMSAQRNPQLWYGSTAGDQDVAPCGQLARLRRRGLSGTDPALAYMEWSVDPHTELCPLECDAHDDVSDPEAWARANPSMGIRISYDHISREFASMSRSGFARERLSVGNYPTDDAGWEVVDESTWRGLAVSRVDMRDPVAFAVDVAPGATFGAVAAAGLTPDERMLVDVVEHRAGTSWIVDRVSELVQRWQHCAVVLDPAGPAGALVADFDAAGVEIMKVSTQDAARAFGWFHQAVTDSGVLAHLDQGSLNSALAGARTRKLGDAQAWDRKGPSVDISPLVAATLASWGHATYAHVRRRAAPWVMYA